MTRPNEYADTSYPPVHPEVMRYIRGDGALIELKISPPVSQEQSAPAPIIIPPVSTLSASTKARASMILPPGMPLKINPKASVSTRTAPQRPGKVTMPAQTQLAGYDLNALMDNPAVGGKITVFILFYGGDEYYDLHYKCLSTLLATTPRDRIDLRVGSNALGQRSLELIDANVQAGIITKHYKHTENAYKYPVMREMFHDPTCPITTKWLLWFDDDSTCDADPSWLTALCLCIQSHHSGNSAHMIGASFVWTTNQRQREILESRPWYRNRPWRLQNGQAGAGNGTKIIFSVGGFWALTTEAMRAADIPDLGTGLQNTGGDWQIGEQLYQAGYSCKQFNGKKQFVRTSSAPRRGETTPLIDKL